MAFVFAFSCAGAMFFDYPADRMPEMFAGLFAFWMIVVAVSLILGLIINWRIAVQAGYSGPMSLLMLLPLVNIIILLIFAFSEWPVQAELREARAQLARLPRP
jgi:hypothetical protein